MSFFSLLHACIDRLQRAIDRLLFSLHRARCMFYTICHCIFGSLASPTQVVVCTGNSICSYLSKQTWQSTHSFVRCSWSGLAIANFIVMTQQQPGNAYLAHRFYVVRYTRNPSLTLYAGLLLHHNLKIFENKVESVVVVEDGWLEELLELEQWTKNMFKLKRNNVTLISTINDGNNDLTTFAAPPRDERYSELNGRDFFFVPASSHATVTLVVSVTVTLHQRQLFRMVRTKIYPVRSAWKHFGLDARQPSPPVIIIITLPPPSSSLSGF